MDDRPADCGTVPPPCRAGKSTGTETGETNDFVPRQGLETWINVLIMSTLSLPTWMRSFGPGHCTGVTTLLCLVVALVCGYSYAGEAPKRVCVTDDLQRRVCVDHVPKRVVSFAPNLTEMVFALDAGDRLVGRTQRCNVPPEALKVPEIGAYLKPDFERVLASRPDLVLTNRSATRKEIVHRLDLMGIPVFVADTKTIDGIYSVLRRLGILLDRQKRSRDIVAELRRRRTAIQDRVSESNRPIVLFAVGIRPLVAAGGKSFIGSLIREVGGINIAEDAAKPFVRYSIEEVIKQNPDVILVLNKECAGQGCIDLWREHDVLTAVRKGRVYPLDADLMARPSPRIMDELEELAGILHQCSSEGQK